MSQTGQLVESLARKICCGLTEKRGDAVFFAKWLETKLPKNAYEELATEPKASDSGPSGAQVQSRRRALINKGARKQADDDHEDGVHRVRQLDLSTVEKRDDRGAARMHILKDDGVVAATITSEAYDSSARQRSDTVSRIFEEERRQAIRSLHEAAKRFYSSSSTPIGRLSQTLVILALEPIDVRVEIGFAQLLPLTYVSDQLRLTAHAVGMFALIDGGADDNEDLDVAHDQTAGARYCTYNRLLLFGRFRELAVDIDEHLPEELLRATASLWALGEQLFAQKNEDVSVHGGGAFAEFRFNAIFERVFGDRRQLLAAFIDTHVVHASNRETCAELFYVALQSAHSHLMMLLRFATREQIKRLLVERADALLWCAERVLKMAK